MGNIQKVYVLCLGIQWNVVSQVKTFSFGAGSGMSIRELMIDSGEIVWIWNKIREYIWQDFVCVLFFYLSFFTYIHNSKASRGRGRLSI